MLSLLQRSNEERSKVKYQGMGFIIYKVSGCVHVSGDYLPVGIFFYSNSNFYFEFPVLLLFFYQVAPEMNKDLLIL